MSHHRAAVCVVAVTLLLDLAAAVAFAHLAAIPILPPAHGTADGLDWAVATMVTTGDSNIVPLTRPEHWLSIAVHLSLIPLGAASISFFTSGLTKSHVEAAEDRIKRHVEQHAPGRDSR